MRIGFGSKDIGTLDWASLVNLRVLEDSEAIKALAPFKHNYVLPQLMAFIGGTSIKLQRNEDNKVSASLTLKSMSPLLDAGDITFSKGQEMTKHAFIGILRFLTYANRKEILPEGVKQVAPEWARFSTNVPLVLSAFKELRNLKYADWDFKDPMIDQLVDPKLLAVLVMAGTEVGWESSELQAFQLSARTVKTGTKAGTLRHLNSTVAISKVGDTAFDSLPSLVRTMLLQTWVYQPSIASTLSIRNLFDIDAAAEPLNDTNVFKPYATASTTKLLDEVSW